MTPRRRGLAALSAVALCAAGCRSPSLRMVELDRGDPGALRVVVAPMNLPVQLAPDLEDAVDPVSEELIRYFQGHGARVAVIFPPDAWSLWRDCAAAVQAGRDAPAELGKVASVFSRALADHADFDLLVLPSLVFRDADVKGPFALWDGVRRRIRFRARSGVPLERAQPIPDPLASTDRSQPGPLTPEWRGRITGLSIHALVFTPEGGGVFQGFGGLDLVHDAVQQRQGSAAASFLRLHPTLLENTEHVREGIGLALGPYLVQSRSR